MVDLKISQLNEGVGISGIDVFPFASIGSTLTKKVTFDNFESALVISGAYVVTSGALVTDIANLVTVSGASVTDVNNLTTVSGAGVTVSGAAVTNTTHRGSAGGTDHSDVSTNNSKVSFTKDNIKGFINHGGTAGTARPSGFDSVEWLGTVEPSNATNDDTWIDVT